MINKQRKNNFIYSNPLTLISFIFSSIGIAFLLSGLIIYLYYTDDKFVECEYGFTLIDLDNINQESVFHFYDNDGIEHTVTVTNMYSSTWTEGSSFVGKYEINNPNHILLLEPYIILITVFSSIGFSFDIVAVILFVIEKRKKKSILICKKKGKKVIAKVINTFQSSYTMGHIHSEYLTCIAEFDGEKIMLKSANSFTHDLCKEFHHFDEASMKFIVNAYIINKNQYYVDLDSLRVDEIDL